MAVLALSVTEFSRRLSDFLSQVQYQGQSLEIQRGKRVIARVLPAAAPDGFPLDQLDALLARGPVLSSSEKQSMARDVRAVRSQLRNADDPWLE